MIHKFTIRLETESEEEARKILTWVFQQKNIRPCTVSRLEYWTSENVEVYIHEKNRL